MARTPDKLADAARYEKEHPFFSVEYPASGVDADAGQEVELQVSLGDMDLEEAFRMTVPHGSATGTIGELLETIFLTDEHALHEIRDALNTVENPDLPAMYDALGGIIVRSRSGIYAVRYFANYGPELVPSDRVSDHLGLQSTSDDRTATPILDLVIEARYDSLALLVQQGYHESKGELLDWLQAWTLLYYLDKHAYPLSPRTADEGDRGLLPIAEQLLGLDMIADGTADGDDGGAYVITAKGRGLIAQMIAETESLIDRFDVFQDVVYDPDGDVLEFLSGYGVDLRVEVYEAEGIDSIRSVFLLRMYDESLDAFEENWREAILDEQTFNDLLSPAVERIGIDDALLQRVIDSGYAYVDERDYAARERRDQDAILRRIQASRPTAEEARTDDLERGDEPAV